MRKTFPLTIEGRHPDRVLDAIKHEIRKYLQRERRRPVPEGAQFWDFDCRIGATQDAADPVSVTELKPRLDALARDGLASVYLEILARPGVRAAPPAGAAPVDG